VSTTSTRWFIDASVSVPLLMAAHEFHDRVDATVDARTVELAAHAHFETYAVLTRLPGDARVDPVDAARLLVARFGPPVALPSRSSAALVSRLAGLGISGGATYDALIAATVDHVGGTLLTRDRRALATYRLLGTSIEFLS
jgi:predicted nucleic acid-binding protein